MKSENNIPCPKCNSITAVLGKLEPNDSERQFDGKFYPLYIKPNSFYSMFSARVNLDNNNDFYACYSCGHLWGQVNINKLQEVLEKYQWNGELQTPPKKPHPILEWLLYGVAFSIVLFVAYIGFIENFKY